MSTLRQTCIGSSLVMSVKIESISKLHINLVLINYVSGKTKRVFELKTHIFVWKNARCRLMKILICNNVTKKCTFGRNLIKAKKKIMIKQGKNRVSLTVYFVLRNLICAF